MYADVTLTYRPVWLDTFRGKYGSRYSYHITLKQPSYIREEQVVHLRKQLALFFGSFWIPNHAITITFDAVKSDIADGSIMLVSNQCALLHDMQEKLVHALGTYKYYDPESEKWEYDFRPHLTIAYDLAPELVDQARADIRLDDLPRGLITEVTLVVVNNVNPEEATLPRNLSHYRL